MSIVIAALLVISAVQASLDSEWLDQTLEDFPFDDHLGAPPDDVRRFWEGLKPHDNDDKRVLAKFLHDLLMGGVVPPEYGIHISGCNLVPRWSPNEHLYLCDNINSKHTEVCIYDRDATLFVNGLRSKPTSFGVLMETTGKWSSTCWYLSEVPLFLMLVVEDAHAYNFYFLHE